MSINGTSNGNNGPESEDTLSEDPSSGKELESLASPAASDATAEAPGAQGVDQVESPKELAEGHAAAKAGGQAESVQLPEGGKPVDSDSADEGDGGESASADAPNSAGAGPAESRKGGDPAKRGKHVAVDRLSSLGKVAVPLEPLAPLEPLEPANPEELLKPGGAQGAGEALGVEEPAVSATAAAGASDFASADQPAAAEKPADADRVAEGAPSESAQAAGLDGVSPSGAGSDTDELAGLTVALDAPGLSAGEQPYVAAPDASTGSGGSTEASQPTVPIDSSAALQPITQLHSVEPIADGVDASQAFVAAGFGEIPKKKRRRALKALGITLGAIVAALLVAYGVGVAVFSGHMLPNTVIGERDISLEADEAVRDLLDGVVTDYRLDVVGGGFVYRATGKDIGLSIDSDGIVSAIHEDLSARRWPLLVLDAVHDETELMSVTFDREVYEPTVVDAINKYNEAAEPPVNATIVFDEKTSKFVVKPEEQGTQYDPVAVLAAMKRAITELDPKVVLTEAELIEPAVLSTDEKLLEAAELATGMVSANLTLNMGGHPVGEVDGEMLSSFITINDNLEVVFREDDMNAWVDDIAASYNTVGTERSYTRADGKEIVVPAGGVYGWDIDTEALKGAILEGIKAGEAAQIEVPCIDAADVYNGVGLRDWGNRYIDVDLSEQYVRFYGDDGSIIWESDCISGMPDGEHDTVPGTWMVNYKESPSKLIGYENGKKIYETTVTYWMPFEGNGIGFHDATWQPSFGGTMYASGYGSHGCVNLSYGAAQSLYDIIEIGDCVVVHY